MKCVKALLIVVWGFLISMGAFVACSGDSEVAPVIDNPFASKTGGAVLTFPEDHKLHNGTTMMYKDGTEWYWWAGFGESPDGKQLGFFVMLVYNWDGDEFTPYYPIQVFRINNPDDPDAPGGVDNNPRQVFDINNWVASTGLTEDGQDTYVQYKGDSHSIRHTVGADTWHVVADNHGSGVDLYGLDLTFSILPPGYVPSEDPAALAFQGAAPFRFPDNPDVPEYDPETLRCISYYYSAPRLQAVGTLTVAGETVEVKDGTAWFDHQWGRYLTGCDAFNYNWISIRLNDGANFGIRDWNKNTSTLQSSDSVPQLRRLTAYANENQQKTKYIAGADAFELQQVDKYNWKGQPYKPTGSATEQYNIYGRVYNVKTSETRLGDCQVEAMFSDQENVRGSKQNYWEGGAWVREFKEDGTLGDIIGKAYLEQMHLPENKPPD